MHRADSTSSSVEVHSLVRDLKNAPQEHKARAAKRLCVLVSNHEDDAGAVALGVGVLPVLIGMLSSGTDGGQLYASSCLASLAAAGHSAAIVKGGAIGPLVQVLKVSSMGAVAAAASALLGLSEEHAPELIKTNVTAPFVRLLKQGNTDAREYIASMIANLSRASFEAEAAFVGAGAIEELLRMLSSAKTCNTAAWAIASLCSCTEHVEAISAAGGIAKLLELLNTSINTASQVAAAAAISNLARDHPPTQTAIAKAGGIGPLLALLASRSPQAQAQAAEAVGRLCAHHRENQDAVGRMGGISSLAGLLASGTLPVQAMAAFAVCEASRGHADNQTAFTELGGISNLVMLLRQATSHASHVACGGHVASGATSAYGTTGGATTSDGFGGLQLNAASAAEDFEAARTAHYEAIRVETAGALWILSETSEANRVSIAASGALAPLAALLASGGARGREHAAHALAHLAIDNVTNQHGVTTLLVGLLAPSSAVEARKAAAELLWRLVRENDASIEIIAAASSASELVELLKTSDADARAFALWALSLAIDGTKQATVLEDGGVAPLLAVLRTSGSLQREQAAAALARLANGSAAAQAAIAAEGGISPLLNIVEGVNCREGKETAAARVHAASAIASLARLAANRDTIIESGGITPLVALLNDGEDAAKTGAAAALAYLAVANASTPGAIAQSGAISPLVSLLTGEHGAAAQEAAAGALHALAHDADNRIAIAEAGAIGHLVLLLGSVNPMTSEFAEGALVRLSIENSNRELIIHKLVGMLYDKGSEAGGEEQAAAALANLASDSDANRDSIVEAGGIAPLLSLLESSSSTKAKERAIGAISQLASRRTIQKEIAKAGGIPLLASVILASQSNGKQEKGADIGIASKLYALAAFAASQLAKGNRLNQTALADAGAIQPLVAMLGSPNSDMQANAACALGTLAEAHSDNQAAIARTGAIAPLTSLVREGAPLVKEMCAGALWAVCDDHAPNKSTVTKLGGVEPLVGLLVSGGTEASLIASVGALVSLATKHPENREAIAKLLVARLSSRVAMAGAGAVRVLRAVGMVCDEGAYPANQLALAKAGGLPSLIAWLSGSADARWLGGNPDAQREAAHAVLSMVVNNATLQAAIVQLDAIPPLIELLIKAEQQAQAYAARTLFHLAATLEGVEAIEAAGGVAPLVQLLSSEHPLLVDVGAVVISRLTTFSAHAVAVAGGIAPLMKLISMGSHAAQQHAASALADIGSVPAHRDAIAFGAEGSIQALVHLLGSHVAGTPEVAARALSQLARDEAECANDGGVKAMEASVEAASGAKPGAARRQLILACGGIDRLIMMLWAIPNKGLARRMWDLISSIVGSKDSVEVLNGETNSFLDVQSVAIAAMVKARATEKAALAQKAEKQQQHRAQHAVTDKERVADKGSPSQKRWQAIANAASPTRTDTAQQQQAQQREVVEAREEAALALADLAYGDRAMQSAILAAGGVPPLLRLIREGSAASQEAASRAIWHLCASLESQGVLVACGAVEELVALSRNGSPAAQDTAAAVISDLAKGAILERERRARESGLGLESMPADETTDPEESLPPPASPLPPVPIPPLELQPSMKSVFHGEAPLLPSPIAQASSEAMLGSAQSTASTDWKPQSGDRLNAIAAAGGIVPLVSLVQSGSQAGKERAASALWHLANDPSSQVAIAKAGGIAPLVQLLDDGTLQGTIFAADALTHLARGHADNQAAIAKKLVGLLEVDRPDGTLRRAARALWKLADENEGAPVRVVNAGAISPLVALLGTGSMEAKSEAVGALTCLATNDPKSQLAIATGLVALLGSGTAESQEHVTSMLLGLSEKPDNRRAIAHAGAVQRLIVQLRGGGALEAASARTSLRAQELGAQVLLRLSRDDEANAHAIVAHGGLRFLVALLSAESAEAQVNAADVLCDVARRSTEIQSRVAAEGAVEILVKLLSSTGPLRARTAAAGALWSLSIGHAAIQAAVTAAGAIPELVQLLCTDDAGAQRQAAAALAALAVGGHSIQGSITSAGGIEPLVRLLDAAAARAQGSTAAQAASALAALVANHPANQAAVAAAGGIEPLVALIRDAGAEDAKEEAATALWALTASHPPNQSASAEAGAIVPLVAMLGAGGTRAQAQAASALASMALGHNSNQGEIASMLVHLLNAEGEVDESKGTKAARAISRLARAHEANQEALAAHGALVSLVRLLRSTCFDYLDSLPDGVTAALGSRRPGREVMIVGGTPIATPVHTPLHTPLHTPRSLSSNLLRREIASALWSMADGSSANQEAIAAEGGVPLLIALLSKDFEAAVQREAAGALWSLATQLPAIQRRIADSGGLAPLVSLLSSTHVPTQETAAGALNSLASLAMNRTVIAEVKGVAALVGVVERGSAQGREQAAGALLTLVQANSANQSAVSSELIARLGESSKATAEAQGEMTNLVHRLSLDSNNRAALAKAGAIPALALQMQRAAKAGAPGAARTMVAAAAALAQIALKSPQVRIQVTAQLISLLGAPEPEVRQCASSTLREMAAEGSAESQVTVATMPGGIERIVALLREGSVEAQEYTLWMLAVMTDAASKSSIAHSPCTRAVVEVFRKSSAAVASAAAGKELLPEGAVLSALAQEHAAAVLALLAANIPGVDEEVRSRNSLEISASGGIRPLVWLLREGTAGAKRHSATALTQLACGPMGRSSSMQIEMARAGATAAFGAWLREPSLGPPELAAQALACIANRNADTQTLIAEEGAIPPLVAMLQAAEPSDETSPLQLGFVTAAGFRHKEPSDEAQRWAASALAALAQDHPVNQITIAEEGAISALVDLLKCPKSGAAHENATRVLWHLAADADNQLSVTRAGGLAPLVMMLSAEAPKTAEWAAAALAALSLDCAENQVAIARAGAIPRLVSLIGSPSDETQLYAQSALVLMASSCPQTRCAVVQPLVELLDEYRLATAQMKAAETLSMLAARSTANRTAIAQAGAIAPLVRLLGDGTNANKSQISAAATLADLARAASDRAAIASVGGVSPLVEMLRAPNMEAQARAVGALLHLSSLASAQASIVERNGIALLVALLDSERLCAANHAAGALWQVASTAAAKGAIIKAGGLSKLVALLLRTDAAEAKEPIAALLADLARTGHKGDATKGTIVAAGAIAPLVALLEASSVDAQKHAACALWGLTDGVSAHQAAATAAGAVPLLVSLLGNESEAQGFAAAALCNLAEDAHARQQLVDAGAVRSLQEISKGPQTWLRTQAVNLLNQLDVFAPPSDAEVGRKIHLQKTDLHKSQKVSLQAAVVAATAAAKLNASTLKNGTILFEKGAPAAATETSKEAAPPPRAAGEEALAAALAKAAAAYEAAKAVAEVDENLDDHCKTPKAKRTNKRPPKSGAKDKETTTTTPVAARDSSSVLNSSRETGAASRDNSRPSSRSSSRANSRNASPLNGSPRNGSPLNSARAGSPSVTAERAPTGSAGGASRAKPHRKRTPSPNARRSSPSSRTSESVRIA